MDVETYKISVSKRNINPHKIAVKQFESGTTMLKFEMDSCKIDQIDLRNYTPYAMTSINGMVDMTELVMETSGTTMTLTWVLSERTLRYAGAINYQIVFKDVNEDGDGSAVYSTYQAIIQCSASIDAERVIAADYPTVLKQQLDLIRTLSGAFGAEVVYMQAGEPIPVEERLDGRLYYQWLDVPKTRATCATGTVNLGKRPYADSGLYINDVHICVDNTSDVAYVIDPDVWVNTINNANCGVTATDISSGEDIVLLISAKNSGEAGNNIGLRLGTALYGGASGVTNPSGGRVSGTTLAGGSDAYDGVDTPTGQLEDAHGNILATTPRHSKTWGKPNWSGVVDVSSLPYTAPSDGFILIVTWGNDYHFSGTIGDVRIETGGAFSNYHEADTACFPVTSGDVLASTSTNATIKFIPTN